MKNKSLIQKGVANVPVILQMEALECGAASLAMIMAYFNTWLPLEKVRVDCGVSKDGSNGRNILYAARNYGMIADGYHFSVEKIKAVGKFPCIIHWNMNHFVVLCGFKDNKAIINDPASGRCEIPLEEFNDSFTGICFIIEPSENYVTSGKKKSIFDFVNERLKNHKKSLIFLVATTASLSFINIFYPLFTNYYVENVLTGIRPIKNFVYAFIIVMLIQLVIEAIKSCYTYRINGELASKGSTSYMWKLLNLPVNFFSQRSAGDLQSRYMSNAKIATSIVNKFAPTVINSFMLIIYLVAMIYFNPVLALIGVISQIINFTLLNYINNRRLMVSRLQSKSNNKLNSTTISAINMIETIKASGSEEEIFEKWSACQAGVNTQDVKFAKINQYLGILPQIVNQLTSAFALGYGTYLASNGILSLGGVMAFSGLLQAFNKPATELISTGQEVLEMRSSMERIDDVMKYPEDELISKVIKDGEYKKLNGDILISNVSYRYAPLSKSAIEDVSIEIKHGEKIAIVGKSGAGKSTLASLIAGIYKPETGSILYDDKDILEIDRDEFRGSLSLIENSNAFLEDTVANNIKMFDETIEDYEMIIAAKDAQIHDDIIQRDGGYNHIMIEGGRSFSGGQIQRIEIARALAQDPSIIIMDEATSALDAKTESAVMKAIKDRNVTTIIIAQRLSTIEDCDEIIVLDDGKIVEHGKHEELLALNGLYKELITKV